MPRSVVLPAALAALVALGGCVNFPQSDNSAASSAAESARAPLSPVRSAQPLAAFTPSADNHADETTPSGSPPFTSLIPTDYATATPLLLPGAARVTTGQLHGLVVGKNVPLLINVQPADGVPEMLDGAIWLSGAGAFGTMRDEAQTRFDERLRALTGGNKRASMVFYCEDRFCWHAYNAGNRALALGYRQVRWYRGGLRAWFAAGLPALSGADDRW